MNDMSAQAPAAAAAAAAALEEEESDDSSEDMPEVVIALAFTQRHSSI